MSVKQPDIPEPPNSRLGWSIYFLSVAVSCFICGVLAPFHLVPFLAGGMWFWVAIAFGCLLAVVVNFFRPRYEAATGRWRAFYEFLLKQLPPPD
jgi:hypothetical protein